MADVLLVDDDNDALWLLAQVLMRVGHVVRVAGNGEEGLAALKERLPDVVILDVEMPVLDGPSMVDRMFLHDCGLESIPIILLSGVADLAHVAAHLGTPYYLSKPFDGPALLALTRRAITERVLPHPTP